MQLGKNERVLTAYAESQAGPGWANRPIIVIIQAGDKTMRLEWIQPEEQTAEMHALYGVSQAVHRAMIAAVTPR